MTANRDALLEAWKLAAETLAEAKAYETELRQQVVAAFSEETNELATGIENVPIGWGHVLKITHCISRKFDSSEAAETAQNLVSRLLGEELTHRLIKWKPELSQGEYNLAPAEVRQIIDRVTTCKPGAKQVKIAKLSQR